RGPGALVRAARGAGDGAVAGGRRHRPPVRRGQRRREPDPPLRPDRPPARLPEGHRPRDVDDGPRRRRARPAPARRGDPRRGLRAPGAPALDGGAAGAPGRRGLRRRPALAVDGEPAPGGHRPHRGARGL
ncbi:MAG: Probable (3R)-hydroxyacyl-CoA dehydratase HtdX, partial [uncultured Quadrisphaera sp.]